MTLAVRLPEDLEKRLSTLAKRTHRSKSSFVCEALREYLEDQEDYYDALEIMQRMEKNKEKSYSVNEVVKMLGLEEEMKEELKLEEELKND